jgi:hypothetical protein
MNHFLVPPSRGESTEPTIAAFSAAQNSSAEPKDNPKRTATHLRLILLLLKHDFS